MTLSIHIPVELEETLRHQFGTDLELRAKEQLAMTWFSEGPITSRQVAQLLNISLFAAHEFLKERGVAAPMSMEDIENDLNSLRGSH